MTRPGQRSLPEFATPIPDVESFDHAVRNPPPLQGPTEQFQHILARAELFYRAAGFTVTRLEFDGGWFPLVAMPADIEERVRCLKLKRRFSGAGLNGHLVNQGMILIPAGMERT